MKQNNLEDRKYYIPDISEFYIGFEYEYLTVKDKWTTDVFGSGKPLHTEQMLFDIIKVIIETSPEEIRVKYLDQKDIEDLGWIYTNPEIDGQEEYSMYNFVNKDVTMILTWINTKSDKKQILHNISITKIGDDGFRFIGTIKNKSELKKLLKQLNIK